MYPLVVLRWPSGSAAAAAALAAFEVLCVCFLAAFFLDTRRLSVFGGWALWKSDPSEFPLSAIDTWKKIKQEEMRLSVKGKNVVFVWNWFVYWYKRLSVQHISVVVESIHTLKTSISLYSR